MDTSFHLENGTFIVVRHSLSIAVGLNAAIVLHAIHKWLEHVANKRETVPHHDKHENYFDNRWWVYSTYERWRKHHFPFWSISTIKRIFAKLREDDLIETRASSYENRDGNFVTINYQKVHDLIERSTARTKMTQGVYQNDTPPVSNRANKKESVKESKERHLFTSTSVEVDVRGEEPTFPETAHPTNPDARPQQSRNEELNAARQPSKNAADKPLDFADLSEYTDLEKWVIEQTGATKKGLTEKQRKRLRTRIMCNHPSGQPYEEHSPDELWQEQKQYRIWCVKQVDYAKGKASNGRISVSGCVTAITNFGHPTFGWVSYAEQIGAKLNYTPPNEVIGMEASPELLAELEELDRFREQWKNFSSPTSANG